MSNKCPERIWVDPAYVMNMGNPVRYGSSTADYFRGDLVKELVEAVYQANKAHPSIESLGLAENRLANAVSAIEVLNTAEEGGKVNEPMCGKKRPARVRC